MDEIAKAVAAHGHKVVVVTLEGASSSTNPFIIQASSLDAAHQIIRTLLKSGETAVLYIARLVTPEWKHSKYIADLAHLGCPILLRAQSTKAATLLIEDHIAEEIEGKVDLVHALNPHSCDLLKEVYSQTRITLSPNPFPTGFVRKKAREDYVMFSGRITPSKNLHSLIIAWLLLDTRTTKLRIFGTIDHPKYFAFCESLSSGIETIEWLPAYTPGDTTALECARFLVLPSLREGHSNLLSEAMALGTFVLGSDIPGISEHLSDGRGISVPPTVQGLYAGLKRVLSMNDSEVLSYTAAAKKYANERCHDIQLDDILSRL